MIGLRARLGGLGQLVRFYEAALVNTAFGFGTFALLVWLGMNPFAAQIVSHLLGMSFNYFTYSLHVFRGSTGAKKRFVAAYAVNYVVNLAFLALFQRLVGSPYLAGLLAVICASLVNFFALKRFVFLKASA